MLHITQRSVERGLDFNQISLIQDKIRQFFFFYQETSLLSNFASWKFKSFALKRKKTTKVTNGKFFNWSETRLLNYKFHTLF